MLEVSNLTKSFAAFKALDNLTMTVPQGGVYGLVGPNGAGKSTVIRCLTGIYKADSGSITCKGLPVYENPKVKEMIGYIPDDVFFFPSATLEEMAKYYAGIYPAFDMTLFNRMKEVFKLPPKGQLRRMSKGQQKQAAFQLILASRPQLLVLDEPVDGLDPVMRRQVWSLILSEVAQRETTVLVSSHNLRELEDICDHVGILNQGKMLLERSLASMQGSTHKLQLVGEIPDGLEILHKSSSGRMQTLIVRGEPKAIESKIAQAKPIYCDMLPLSLEEIFIYELGGVNDEVRNILL